MSELVILVNEDDVAQGTMEKLAAHKAGKLHRAVSVFLFNENGDMLLQQRAAGKYHSAGLWSNTCCSHPRPGEEVYPAAMRRLQEEMGLSCRLTKKFSFIYKAELENGLTEHELDHVYTGICDEVPQPDPLEVMAWKYIKRNDLVKDVAVHPEQYSEWFKMCISERQEELYNKTYENEKV